MSPMGKRRSLVVRASSIGPLVSRIRDEQVAMLYARNRVNTLLGIPFGLLVCVFAWGDAPHSWLVGWFALKCVTAIGRLVLSWFYGKRAERASSDDWWTRFVVGLGIDGLAWSWLILLFARPEVPELGPIVVAAVIGVGASGLVALSTDRRANAVFAITLLAPGAARLLLLGTRVGVFGGCAIALFLAIILEHGLRVSEATEELLRLRFEVAQARDGALATARAKSDFLATMSHELRTPLNAVIGMAELLADTQMTADQRERLDVIRSSAETLLTLIGDILDVSKIEAGKLEVEAVNVDLARLVEEALDQVAAAAFAKGLELGYEMGAECPAVVVSDKTRVRQILANLLGNAVKFTADGSVTVNVDAAPIDADRTEVTFAIHDTGIGIDAGGIDRLFSPFTQADATTTRRYGGTGLGLAICKSLTELMGGTIGVESEPGRGSTFHFSIVGKALTESRARALPINAGMHVLVLSDSALAQGLLAAHVSGLGFVASRAGSPAEARELVGAAKTDVLVYDARGTAAEAWTVVSGLRETLPALPILTLLPPTATTAFRASASQDTLVAATSKPVKTLRLLELVEALLAGNPAPSRVSSVSDVEVIEPAADPSPSGTALVVDDNELNRRVALEMVRRLGFTARAVGSGKEAIEAVKAERFDYVLMDVQMPDMDGFEATRRLLAVATGKKPRVIATTANALPGDRERCLAAGMTDYVTKPVRPNALAAALKRKPVGDDGGTERSGITDVLDASVLEDLRMLEETSGTPLIAELATSFRTDVPAKLDELRAALAKGDWAAVRSVAHRLRGSAGAIGANRVFVTATEIETKATGPEGGIEPLVDALAKEVGRAIDAFGRVLERTNGARGQTGGSPSA
jgi:signal transduction histidine kinase/CheY-like chemotaxis protein